MKELLRDMFVKRRRGRCLQLYKVYKNVILNYNKSVAADIISNDLGYPVSRRVIQRATKVGERITQWENKEQIFLHVDSLSERFKQIDSFIPIEDEKQTDPIIKEL